MPMTRPESIATVNKAPLAAKVTAPAKPAPAPAAKAAPAPAKAAPPAATAPAKAAATTEHLCEDCGKTPDQTTFPRKGDWISKVCRACRKVRGLRP